ncbi:MAG: hypothetical protein J6V66_03565 [Clostridia bacterium]|nr:hypothetical protein [Clostridia bacterium]MBP5466072.1 hypothetical protein [Clostridia bacterium]
MNNFDNLKITGLKSHNDKIDKIAEDLKQKAQNQELINTVNNLSFAVSTKIESVTTELKEANKSTEKQAKKSFILSLISIGIAFGSLLVALIAIIG